MTVHLPLSSNFIILETSQRKELNKSAKEIISQPHAQSYSVEYYLQEQRQIK